VLGVALAAGTACGVDTRDGGEFGFATTGVGDEAGTDGGDDGGDADETGAGDDDGADAPETSASAGSSSSGGGEDDGDASESTGADGDAGPSFGSGSAFDDVMDMFAYVNETRESYLTHERWRGLPWSGSGHATTTWPTTFAWDDGLAAQAQAEADAIAGGAAFVGSPASDGWIPAIYVQGVSTAHYAVAGVEASQTWGVENQSALSHHHGSARMAIYYQDPGGEGPVLTRLGIGAADAGGGDTIWVFVWE
jgi:hypothetical protein